MHWNDHYDIKDRHAFLSPSGYHWLNYTDEKLISVWKNMQAKERGSRLHAWAEETIKLGRRQPRSDETLCLYVNDAIKFRMRTEQPLIYSLNCFGHADAISFDGKTLRIHDLKTGETVAHMEQLEVYAALFCLEYQKNPQEIAIELRIYQSDSVSVYNPPSEDIIDIMNKIVRMDSIIEDLKREAK